MNYQKEAPEEVIDMFRHHGIEPFNLDYHAFPETFGSTAGARGGIGGAAMTTFTVEAYVCSHENATVYVCDGVQKFARGKYKANWAYP